MMTFTLATGMAVAAGPTLADPVVVELFTSQGCSSCPPADANLIRLSDRPDVIALSFGVTYWNYLGWDDTFAREEFTQRQLSYERPLGRAGAFTPQMVINGHRDAIGHDLQEIEGLIADAAAAPSNGPSLQFDGTGLSLSGGVAPAKAADIWLVTYERGVKEIPVARGENRRRILEIAHAVRSLTRIGTWTGEDAQVTLPSLTEGLDSAILVQAGNGGPIIAAVRRQ
ncbi:DUF1223 domain-containing protein [Dongia sp.]|uniref:DUF1223 domain-containing protein n=1 Tax=Dongia sp. TaxID=1977262 RepID=UPI0035B0DCF2